jgi:hypothetical protein
MGRSPRMGGDVMAWGVGCPVERETVSPYEDILLSHPVDRVLGILARPLASTGRRRMSDLLVRCHYYWEVSG